MLDNDLEINKISDLPKENWPIGLSNIPCPPKKLNVRGLNNFIQMKNDGYKFLTVVGSRNYTNYGEEVCKEIISGLSGYNICVVSGLAYGIDSIAHNTAIENNLKTIAWPGSSLEKDFIYPKAHLDLAHNILNSGGALLSEFENEMSGNPWMFPQRNRLMVGMADAVLIIEAAEKSGSGITAHMATEYDRNLLVIPGSIFNHNSEMTNRLIRSGATPVCNSRDIIEELGFETLFERDKGNSKNKAVNLNSVEKSVLGFMQRGLSSKDEIIKEMKIPISELRKY